MRQLEGKISSYARRTLAAGIVILMAACSDTTAPKHVLSVTSSQGIPVIKGSITFTGTSAIVDTTLQGPSAIVDTILQVWVTVKNDSTAPVSFGYGPCGLNFALYQSAGYSGNPIWQTQNACQLTNEETVAAGQSLTVTTVFRTDSLRFAIPADSTHVYYIAANTISYGGNNLIVGAGAFEFK